ncbi:MAG: von Willebrand factor type A domain-containing protein [Planctomycetaceae bacterium]|nr:von Willebrand factor type A domain-containing protein [Planctomycetaceae bacterium]
MTILSKSDQRLTSFVLGELPEAEMKEIQTAISTNPELQTEIENIRQTVKEIETAMKNELLPEKLNLAPKPQKRFMRIAAATVTATLAASLLIAGIVVFTSDLLPERKSKIAGLEAMTVVEESDRSDFSINNGSTPPVFTPLTEILPTEIPLTEIPPAEMPLTETVVSGNPGNVDLKKVPYHGVLGVLGTRDSGSVDLESSGEISMRTNIAASSWNAGVGERSSEIGMRTDSFGKTGQIIAKSGEGTTHISGASHFGLPVNSLHVVAGVEEEKLIRHDPYNSANDEAYKSAEENEFKPVKIGEFSTFSIDVDTASYTTMRRYLDEMGKRPPVNSVRIEEYVNYFKYDYAPPTDGKPFATHIDISPCPWEPKHLLARIGIKGKEYSTEERPALNLVFLIDVSGSMEASNRLPLVKRGLTELVEMLQSKDRVAIVTYAGTSRVALPSVSGQEKRAILDSINSLGAGGSTAGAAGIKTAYEVARKYYDKKAQNRVILCTDGDFNVGETNNKTLEEMIGDEAKSGVFLTILGFGMGNYKDERLKMLSMRGNGNYGYIDTPEEARRLLVEGLTGTLFAIAKDVKIQVDFNPATVAGYRLIGYENRKLRDEDFHNDKIDAGEIGAGHTVTALYEIVPTGEKIPATVDQSRYDNKTPATNNKIPNNPDNAVKSSELSSELSKELPSELSNELLFVKLRYKLPDEDKSSLLEYPASAVSKTMAPDSQFAASAALFGMLLRESRYSGNGTFDSVLELATPNTKNDQYRKEFLELVKKAKELK